MILLLSCITLAVCLSQIVGFNRLYRYVQRQLAVGARNYRPPAVVILPCKGLDPGFEENIGKLLKQDYVDDSGKPNFEVIFAVAREDDPAYPFLARVCAQSDVPARLVVAGINPIRAQKINNQLEALKIIPEQAEVIVFVDSDVIAREDFLRCLVEPLGDESIGATTGYRFYVASPGDIPSILRSIWNRMSAWEMARPDSAFAWGGAMAIRRSIFDKAAVAESWDRAADDDLSLTVAVKRLGLTIHFVPQCLVASHGDATIPEIVEWMNRQLILSKVYFPPLWRRGILKAGVMAIWLVAMFAALAGCLTTGDDAAKTAALVGLAILPVEVLFILKAQKLWCQVLSDRGDYLERSVVPFCLAIPLAHVVLPWLTLYSLLTNRIQWRGITYELRSPTETVVISKV
jgi:ceramide glucosyltransferase